jgi:hypothetical protein
MLSLRRAMFTRLLNLPLPKMWDMKTGGILSRLTGDIDTTAGIMQSAIISPTISVIRLNHRDRDLVHEELAAGARDPLDHSRRDAHELYVGAPDSPHLSFGTEGCRAD